MGRVQRLIDRGAGLWLALACMVILALPGFFTLPPVDRDEVLFAQSSSQMLASGDPVDIRFADQPRYKKPIGIYWLQATSAAITGHPEAIWSYRLISLLGALIATAFTYKTARLALPSDQAFLAAILLASSLMLGAEARLAKTDAMLLATVAAAQYVLARLFLPEDRAKIPNISIYLAMGFWLALSASILIKGPIGPMVTASTLAGLCLYRRDLTLLRALKPLPGLALLLALTAPWFIAITLQSNGEFWSASLGRDMFQKLSGGRESHGWPPGSYLALIWATFWPGSILLAAALPTLWRNRTNPLILFAFLWITPTWIIFELTPTKLIHYTLPTYPALALMTAFALTRAKTLLVWPAAIPALVPAALLTAIALQARKLHATLPLGFWLFGILALIATLLILLTYRRQNPTLTALSLTTASLAMATAIYPSLAQLDVLWPAVPLAKIAKDHPDCPMIITGYAEPSLVFLTRSHVTFATPEDLAYALTQPHCIVAVLPQTSAILPDAEPLATIQGLDLGTGKPLQLFVFMKPTAP